MGSELARQLAARALPSLVAASGAPAEKAAADAADDAEATEAAATDPNPNPNPNPNQAEATVDSGALARLLFLLGQLTTGDLKMARHAAAALRRCAAAGAVPPSAARPLVHALEELVLRPPAAAQAEAWF